MGIKSQKRKVKTKAKRLVDCPHCGGDGEELGAPFYEDGSIAICGVCKGSGEVTESKAKKYAKEQKEEGSPARAFHEVSLFRI